MLKCDLENAYVLDGDNLNLVNSREFYDALLAKDVKMDHVVGICSHLSFENQTRFQIIREIVLEVLHLTFLNHEDHHHFQKLIFILWVQQQTLFCVFSG